MCVCAYVYVCVVCNGLGAAGCRHDGLTSAGGKLLGVRGDEVGGQGVWCGGVGGSRGGMIADVGESMCVEGYDRCRYGDG